MIDGGLRTLFRKHLPHEWDMQAIETGGTGRGIPDLNMCHPDHGEVWVEFKQTSAHATHIRPEQVAWAERRARFGGRVFLVVRRVHSLTKADQIYIYSAADFRHVAISGTHHPPIYMSEGGPSRWSWTKISAILGLYGSLLVKTWPVVT
jgi:hypothetical protein